MKLSQIKIRTVLTRAGYRTVVPHGIAASLQTPMQTMFKLYSGYKEIEPHVISTRLGLSFIDCGLFSVTGSYDTPVPFEFAVMPQLIITSTLTHETVDTGRMREEAAMLFPSAMIPKHDDKPNSHVKVIDKVGVELEGGWDHINRIENHRREGDGSVNFDGENPNHDYCYCSNCGEDDHDIDNMRHTGEVHTQPASFKFNDSSRNARFFDQINLLYPDHTNSSCGMHMHFSFVNPAVYSAFACAAFEPWLLAGLRKYARSERLSGWNVWHERMAGHNEFARVGKYSGLNAFYGIVSYSKYGNQNRYHAVNYCYGVHKTMEVRILPMMRDSHEASGVLGEVARLVQVWGQAFSPQARKRLPVTTPWSELAVADVPKPKSENWISLRRPCTCTVCETRRELLAVATGVPRWNIEPVLEWRPRSVGSVQNGVCGLDIETCNCGGCRLVRAERDVVETREFANIIDRNVTLLWN